MNTYKKILTTILCIIFQIYALHSTWAINFEKIEATNSRPEIWYMTTKTVPVVSIKVSVPNGYAYDPLDKSGIASLAAALMDEGAGNLKSDSFQEALIDKQINLNYTASQEYLTLNLNFLKFDALTALNLASLSLFKPRFDKDMIDLMRNKILNNIKYSQKKPEMVASIILNKAYYEDHAFSRPAFGTIKSLKNITQKDLKQYHNNLLKNKMFISVTGDITRSEVIKYVDYLFEFSKDYAMNMDNYEPLKIEQPSVNKQQNISVFLDVPQSTITMATPAVKRHNEQFIAYYIATHILGGGGFGSELVSNLREKNGLTYSIYASLDSSKYDGRLLIQFATSNKNVKKAINQVQLVLNNLAQTGITQERLNQAKTYLKGQYVLAFETNNDITNLAQGLYQSGLSHHYPNKREALFDKVSLEQINQIMRTLFKQPLTKVVVGGNKTIDNFESKSINKIDF